MVRVKLCAAILSALAVISICELFVLKKCQSGLIERVMAAQELAAGSAPVSEVVESVQRVNEYWGECKKYLCLMVPSDKSAELTKSIARLVPLAESGSDELDAEFRAVLYISDWIYQAEFPAWYNIF